MLCNDLTPPRKVPIDHVSANSLNDSVQPDLNLETAAILYHPRNSACSPKHRVPATNELEWKFSLQSTTKQIMQNNQSQSCTMKSPRWRSRGAYRTSRCCPREEGEEPQNCSVGCSPAASAVSGFSGHPCVRSSSTHARDPEPRA